MRRRHLMGLAFLFAMASLAGSLYAGPVAEVENFGDALVFRPVVREFDHIILTVTGPCNYVVREVVDEGEGDLVFRLSNETIDGNYTAELVVIPRIDSGIISILKEARDAGDETVANQLCRDGKLPGDPETQSDGFRIIKGQIVYDLETVEKARSVTKSADFTAALLGEALSSNASVGDVAAGVPTKDFVINDDLIVDGSACIGFDCVNGESFGFDTVRLKENNLRIKFDDTSTAASFPRNDWQLTANDSANGGASKFSIDDISNARTPFTVEANARSHSLYVDDGGRIGNRTSTPSVEIHTIDGDTPTLRLQQDGSSGFAPQTWDVAGNETNFFIRDVTNGSTLPFRIRPGAPSSSIFIDVDGDVGMGTSSPDAPLHVLSTDNSAKIIVSDDTSDALQTMLQLENNGPLNWEMINSANSATWQFLVGSSSQFSIGLAGTGTFFRIQSTGAVNMGGNSLTNFVMDTAGNVTINGTLTELSDATKKTGIEPVDGEEVLQRLEEIPIHFWSYKTDPTVRHLGPMAQDFYAAFELGASDRGLATIDTSGVALAAIKELNRKLTAKDAEVDSLKERLAALEKLLFANQQQ